MTRPAQIKIYDLILTQCPKVRTGADASHCVHISTKYGQKVARRHVLSPIIFSNSLIDILSRWLVCFRNKINHNQPVRVADRSF